MKYKKSPLDRFLEQRINDNAKELKQTLNETLRMEQNCLEQIRHSINHCKNNIAVCEKQIKKCSSASLAILETKKSAFKDNLLIWNTMGHIQMASIEMKEYMKRLSVESIDEWEERDVIKSVYTAIYETSKKLVDATADIFKFIKHYFPMQNLSNIFPNTWSVVTSPTISERWKIHSLKSWEMKSPERLADKPSWTRWMDSRAWVRAS